MRYEIVLSGSGGQGLKLSGEILGKSASFHDKMNCIMTASYGAESRGGKSEAYVVVSPDEPVDYPEATYADVIVALSQPGLQRQLGHLKKETIIIADSELVDTSAVSLGTVYKVPVTSLSVQIMGSGISANIVTLGVLSAITGKFKPEGLRTVIQETFSGKIAEKNLAAFDAGFQAGTQCVKS